MTQNTTLIQPSYAEFKALLDNRFSLSFGTRLYATVIKSTELISVSNDIFVFKAINESTELLIKTKYFEKFSRIVKKTAIDILLITVKEIVILPCKQASQQNLQINKAQNGHTITNLSHHATCNKVAGINFNQLSTLSAVSAEINQKYSFDNFIASKQNAIPFSMVKDFCSGLTKQNQDTETSMLHAEHKLLFVHGSVGNGKTHLLQSSASFLIKNNKTVTYLTADKFVFNYVKAIQANKMVEFKDSIISSDVLIVDDIHFIAGKKSSIEELCNFVSSFLNDGKAVILSSIYSVNSINFNIQKKDAAEGELINSRFKSILHSGVCCNIPNPSYELRREIITKKMTECGIPQDEKIINFLTANITTNIRDIESAIRKIKLTHQYNKTEVIDINFVEKCLEDFLSCFKKSIMPEEVITAVSSRFKISKEELMSENKIKDLTLPRQICMGLLKEFTTLSYQDICIIFGKKSHTTVMYAISSFEKLKLNPTFKQVIEDICSNLKDELYSS